MIYEFNKKILGLVKLKENEVITLNELFVPLKPRYIRNLRETSGMSDVIDFDAINSYITFSFSKNHRIRFELEPIRTIHPNNLLAQEFTEEQLTDSILYTTYKLHYYSFMNLSPELNPNSTENESSNTTYLERVKDFDEKSLIDENQNLIHAYPLASELHLNIHDCLYPDTSTLVKRHEEHVDQDRDLVVDVEFSTEETPQMYRTENEQDMDWMIEDKTPFKPRDGALQSPGEEINSDVEFCVVKNHDRSVYLIPQLALLFPLKYHFFESMKAAPSLLSYFKHVHQIGLFSSYLNSKLSINMKRSELIEAFTAKSVCSFFNYDILETYGDAFLK